MKSGPVKAKWILACLALAGCGPVGDPSGAILFQDSFSDPSLSSSWSVYASGGSFLIVSGKARPIKGTDQPTAWYATSRTETSIQVSMGITITGAAYTDPVYLIARSPVASGSLTTTGSGYLCGYDGSVLRIARVASGTATTLGTPSTSFSLSDGSAATLTFALRGGSLSCSLGAITTTASDTTYASGYYGMQGGAAGSSPLYLDDFTLGSL
jgi:hypothetical protein